MSRVGRKPIDISGGSKVAVEKNVVTVEGPKGKLNRMVSPLLQIKVDGNQVLVERTSDIKLHRSLHGLTRTLIANMVEGVTSGFQKTLELHGVGYRAEVKGPKIVLQIGLSHPVDFNLPAGIEAESKREGQVTIIVIKGIDKEMVGQVSARLHDLYPPEPYKGKGIRYTGEIVRRKAGKTAAA